MHPGDGLTRRRASPRRRGRIALLLFGALPVLLLFAAMIVGVVSISGETVLVGPRGGPKVPVPTREAQAVVLAILVPLALMFGWRLARALPRGWPDGLSAPASTAGLALGEPIVWQGRQGWHGFPRHRLALAALALAGPAVYLAWLWRIWGSGDDLALKLFWSSAATMILGGSVAALLIGGGEAARAWTRDLLGTIVVTDRRVAWLWRGTVHREIDPRHLVAVTLVEESERRGWIALTTRRSGVVTEIDVAGVPHPHAALAAIERLMARTPPG